MKKYSRLFLIFKVVCFAVFFFSINIYTQSLIKKTTSVNALEQSQTEVNALENKLTKLNQNQGKSKKIYIYSTHQQEEYVGGNVVEGSKYLAQTLEKMGYEVIVEESDFEAYGASKGLNYNKLYNVSNTFLTEAILKHGGFDMIIDFHRDSVGANVSRLMSNNKSYAKMMFVIGKLSENVESVRNTSQALSSLIESYVPGISRGILEREAYYNQFVAKKMLLIEVGGVENEFSEVKYSLEVLALAINDYLSNES